MSESDYELRLNTSRSDDIEAFVPDEAEPLWGNDDASNPSMSPIYMTDEKAYHTGVHCSQCYCDVAVHDRHTGVATCPNCGWSSADDESWRDRADELHEEGGVPQRRAEVVALIEAGYTHSEIADELGLNDRSNVGTMVKKYREEDLPESNWLSARGPRI